MLEQLNFDYELRDKVEKLLKIAELRGKLEVETDWVKVFEESGFDKATGSVFAGLWLAAMMSKTTIEQELIEVSL